MSIDSIRSALNTALTNKRVTRDEIRTMVKAAQDGGSIDAAERAELQNILATQGSKFTAAAKTEFTRLLGGTAIVTPPAPPVTPVTPPVVPNQPEKVTIEATRKPWTTTYWPMAGNGNDVGSASSNLWAKDGALSKFDSLLKARGGAEGARGFELKPNLNWLINKESGHYIPSSSLSETDAERTTGVDFNNNGKIDADVKWDFIDSNGQFGKDGKTEGTMSVGWWGSCDKVARAGILFEEPKKDVTLNGVTFTTQDIKGLLTVLADSQGGGSDFVGNRYDANPDTVTLKNGQQLKGTITSDVKFDGTNRRQQDWQINSANLPDEVKLRADGRHREDLQEVGAHLRRPRGQARRPGADARDHHRVAQVGPPCRDGQGLRRARVELQLLQGRRHALQERPQAQLGHRRHAQERATTVRPATGRSSGSSARCRSAVAAAPRTTGTGSRRRTASTSTVGMTPAARTPTSSGVRRARRRSPARTIATPSWIPSW